MDITQGTIPSDWLGEYCCYAVEWPNSPQWLAVLRGVLALPAKGRFWDENTGSIITACNIIKQTYDNNLHLEGVIMACNDPALGQIASALNKIALAMANNGPSCCDGGGSGGAPANQPELNPDEQGTPGTDPPPTGFDTWEQFYAQKCAVAYDIISKLESDLGTLAIMEWGSAGAEAITASLLVLLVTPIPAAAVIALVFLLLTSAAVIISSTALSLVNDNEGDLICALYNGTSSESSLGMFLSEFNDFVDSGVSDPVEQFAVKALMSYMVGASVANRLYTLDSTRSFPVQDCSSCTESGNWIDRWEIEGNEIAEWFVPSDWFGLIAKNDDPVWDVYASVNAHIVKAEFRTLSGWTSVGDSFKLGQDVEGDIYTGDDFDEFRAACETANLVAPASSPTFQWSISSSTTFTVEAKLTLVG